MATTVTMIVGDVRDTLERLAADGKKYDLAVTSPPFLALRSYLPADHPDKHREIGSEPTPAAFLDTLYGLTEQLGRLLPEWASLCFELGDTMAGSGGAGGDYNANGLRAGQPAYKGSNARKDNRVVLADGRTIQSAGISNGQRRDLAGWPQAKSMCLLPHCYTIGLAYGHNPLTGQPTPAGQWRVRNVITWARPNPPVGSLGKRNPHRRTGDQKFRPACSFITVACRGTGRYFDLDAVRTEYAANTLRECSSNNDTGPKGTFGGKGWDKDHANRRRLTHAGAPPLDWHTDGLDGDWLWKLATAPYPGSHYATYPLTLPRRLITAMCPARVCVECGWPSERVTGETTYRRLDSNRVPNRMAMQDGDRVADGVNQWKVAAAGPTSQTSAVAERDTLGWTDCGHNAWRTGHTLDPFAGSGTTAVAAALEGRDATLIDLDERNVDLVRRRLHETVHIHDETRTGDTIVWTVETVTPDELDNIHAGQLNLWDTTDA